MINHDIEAEIYMNGNNQLTYLTTLSNGDYYYYYCTWGSVFGNIYEDIACAASNYVHIYRNYNGNINNLALTLNIGNIGGVKLTELDYLYSASTHFSDLVCAIGNNEAEGGELWIYRNNSGNSFSLISSIPVIQPGEGYIHRIEIIDLNLDGYNDIVCGLDGIIKVYRNDGNYNFTCTQSWLWACRFGLGELNYDGIPDIAWKDPGLYPPGGIPGALGNGDCTFDLNYIWNGDNLYPGYAVMNIQFADLEGFGGQSIIASNGADWWYYQNNTDELPSPPFRLTVNNVSNHPKLQWVQNSEEDIYKYHIWRRYVENGTPVTDWEYIGYTNHPTNYFIDYSTFYLDNKQQYAEYFVRAVDNALNISTPSNIVFFNGIIPNSEEGLLTAVEEPEIPSLGASPNPFNPTTHIEYCVPEAGPVRLAVFDIRGRIVADLVNGVQTEGEYAVQFNGTELPSGVYFARLMMGKDVQTFKLLLVK